MSQAVFFLAMVAFTTAANASAIVAVEDEAWEASVSATGKAHSASPLSHRSKFQHSEQRKHPHQHHNHAELVIPHHARQEDVDTRLSEEAGDHVHDTRASHQRRSKERSLVRRNEETTSEVASPGKHLESGLSLEACERLMLGTWWFHGGSDFREFRIFRNHDNSLWFWQVWGSSPYKRLGRLQLMGSEVARLTTSGHLSTACAFGANLTDGDQIHIYYHFANSRIPETLEVAPARNVMQPVLASRRPAPWVSPSNSALFTAAALLLTSLLAACCWPCCMTSRRRSDACSQRSKILGAASADTPVGSKGMESTDVPAAEQKSSPPTQELGKRPEKVREEWLDSLRLTCIVFMVIRHALQSVERLGRLPPQLDANCLAFFLHGLPIFLYIAGRSCGTSMPPQGSSFVDQLRYLRRRAGRLLLPDLLGAVLVVIPTEYVGREWRPCAYMGERHGFLDWLRAYLFSKTGSGWHCEGLGWLGFLISLFYVQAIVYPWAAALHYQLNLRPLHHAERSWASSMRCWCYPVLWLIAGLSCLGTVINLDGDVPVLLQGSWGRRASGVLRPDVALVLAPLLADMVMVQIAPTGVAAQSAGWRHYFWLAAVLRRIVASVALATFTLRTPFDKSQTQRNNAATLWTELLCFTIFYQQGVIDGLLKTAAPQQHAQGTWMYLTALSSLLPKSYVQKMHVWNPRLNSRVMAGVCWGLWFLLSVLPVPGMMIYGAGFRYPAYRRASAGHFILRSWAVLGVAIWWWSTHLPAFFKRMSGFAELGFSFYFLHWLFIESAMLRIYGRPAIQPFPRGDMPWWAALFVSLLVCCFGVLLCHALFWLLIRRGIRCYQSRDEYIIAIRTST